MRGTRTGNIRVIVFLVLMTTFTFWLVLYALKSRPTRIPPDTEHRRSSTGVQCLSCHGWGGSNARGPSHPLDDKCFSCHARD